MKQTLKDALRLFHDGSRMFAQVEENGIKIDVRHLDKTIAETKEKIKELESSLREDKVFYVWRKKFPHPNINSLVQLGTVVFGELGYESRSKTETGRFKADEEAFEHVNLPFVRGYLKLNKLKKLKSTFLEGLLRETVDGYFHPSFNLHLATTYRSSSGADKITAHSRELNFQNLPVRDPDYSRPIRESFIARKGRRLVEVDYSALEFKVAACVVGSTLIETIDGPQTIKKVIERVDLGEKVYVYGYDHEKDRIAVSQVLEGGITRTKAEVWRVTLDNGETIDATSDHRFLLRNGWHRKLKMLQPGDSLMPFYKKTKRSRWGTNYTDLYLNNGDRMLAHNLIALDVFGANIGNSGLVVHHWNGKGTDNSLNNIEIMGRDRHMSIHSKQGWNNYRKGECQNRNGWHKTEEGRESTRQMMRERKEKWTDKDWEEWRTRLSEGIRSKGGRAGERNGMFGKNHSISAKEKMSERKKGFTPSAAGWNKGLTKETSESIKRMSEFNKGKEAWNKGKSLSPLSEEVRKKISEAGKGRKVSQKTKEIISNKLKHSWSKREKRQCVLCGNKYKVLHVHVRQYHKISWVEYLATKNHKVISVEKLGQEDVYNITVDGLGNYATKAGVIIKNCFWRDPAMITYASDSTLDIHRDMAAVVFKCGIEQVSKMMRYCAKNMVVFPLLYGSYYVQCARHLWEAMDKHDLKFQDGTPVRDHLKSKGITSLGDCDPSRRPKPGTYELLVQQAEKDFNTRFKVFASSKESWWKAYQATGEFQMMTGFVVRGSYSRNFLMNAPIQGPGFHLLLWSMIEIQKRINKEAKQRRMRSLLVGTIHDCLIGDCPKEEVGDFLDLSRRVMTEEVWKHWDWVIVPLGVEADATDVGGNWYAKFPVAENQGIWKTKEGLAV